VHRCRAPPAGPARAFESGSPVETVAGSAIARWRNRHTFGAVPGTGFDAPNRRAPRRLHFAGFCPDSPATVRAGVPAVPAGSVRARRLSEIPTRGRNPMAVVSMRELLEAGVHFGHQTRRWNPKVKRFLFTDGSGDPVVRGGIYIIDLQQTVVLLEEAAAFARNLAERNGTILFVGTKKQAQDAIEENAKRVGMPYVNHRWLG